MLLVIVVLIVIIIVAAIVASPFGITISEEVTDAGTIPLSQIIAEYNVELHRKRRTWNYRLTIPRLRLWTIGRIIMLL